MPLPLVLILVGAVLVVGAVAVIYLWAAPVVAGCLLMAAGVDLARRGEP